MEVYTSILAIVSVASFFSIFNQFYRARTILLFGIFVMLFLFAGLRYETGFDYHSYKYYFDTVSTISDVFKGNIDMEKGYLLLNVIIKKLNVNFNGILIVMAFMSLIILFSSYKKYTGYYIIAILIYLVRFYFIRDMGQIRQSLACAIIMFSLKYIQEKNARKYIMAIIIASLFHRVALVGFIIYFLYKFRMKITNKVALLWILLSIMLGYLGVASKMIYVFSPILPIKVVNYLYSDFVYNLGILKNPVVLNQLLFLFLGFKFRKTISNKNKYFDLILLNYLISTVILIVFNDMAVFAGRISTVFATVEPILIANLLYSTQCKNKKFIIFLLIIVYVILMFYVNFYLKLYDEFIPYKSILNF